MVGGRMSSAGVGELVRVTQNINAVVYIGILRDHMLPSAHGLIDHEFTIMPLRILLELPVNSWTIQPQILSKIWGAVGSLR